MDDINKSIKENGFIDMEIDKGLDLVVEIEKLKK